MVELTHEDFNNMVADNKTLKVYNIIYMVFILVLVGIGVFFSRVDNHILQEPEDYVIEVYSNKMQDNYIRSRANLIDSIDKYIITVAPSSTLNGSKILEVCDGTYIDIKFVLAQGQLESHFGTKGLASRTNSVFNVWAWDGVPESHINDKGKYKHPDFSVEPYINLLKTSYLVDGKTEMDLLDNFVNCRGERYASNPNYEKQLLDIYSKVNSVVNIDMAYQEYNKYKILSGV